MTLTTTHAQTGLAAGGRHMIHMSNRKMTKYKPKGDINNRVSAGVRTQRGLSGLSGCSQISLHRCWRQNWILSVVGTYTR